MQLKRTADLSLGLLVTMDVAQPDHVSPVSVMAASVHDTIHTTLEKYRPNHTTMLEVAYIIPRTLGFTVRDTSTDIDRKTGAWTAINRFFPRLDELGMTATTVDSVNSMILLASTLQITFDNFD